jgi:cell division protein ZapA (FtsZ GTPase activity inhibitor)
LSGKIRKQVVIAHTPVHISTPLSEEVLQTVVTYVNEKFNRHIQSIGYKSDDEKKIDALVITLLDVAAELISAKQEIKKLKLSDTEVLASFDILNKVLDDSANQVEK